MNIFNVIPAIDLKDHQVVRLKQGLMENSTIYSNNPIDIAKKWIDDGATRLHLVDLNGAFEGKPVHSKEVLAISKQFPQVKIEIGGGIRTLETIEEYIKNGASFCILGTVCVENPTLVRQACEKFPGQIILGLDAKNGLMATKGWATTSVLKATDLAMSFKDCAIAEIIYTDISKDGMLAGMNFESIREMARLSPFPIIGSGGLTSEEDIVKLRAIQNVSGVIAGKAIYEGKIDLKKVISC